MKKLKHNKKRNTAFLYETLVRELTKSIVKKNNQRKEKLMETIKEFFAKDKLLAKELELYKALCETYSMEPHVAEKLIFEIRKQHDTLDKKQIFNEQSSLIKKMNQIISKNAFSSFVPNYKSLATVYQIFNQETPTKERVLLESKMLTTMTTKAKEVIQEMLCIKFLSLCVYNKCQNYDKYDFFRKSWAPYQNAKNAKSQKNLGEF